MDIIENQIVTKGKVVTLDYTLTVDGQVIDASGDEPLEYLQGFRNIIPGLEQELDGMGIGDSKDVAVSPDDAYGQYDPNRVIDLTREQFPPAFPLEIGRELQLRGQNGQVLSGRISNLEDNTVFVDTNHPLAGKELFFRTKIVGLRDATAEELAHGSLIHSCSCGSDCGSDCGSGESCCGSCG